jgi:hypothetical protein
LNAGVGAQSGMIVQVCVAEAQAIDTLAQGAQLRMVNEFGIARVGNDLIHGFHEPDTLIGGAQQRHPAVGRDLSSGELGLHAAAFEGRRLEGSLGTIWRGRVLFLILI